MKSLPNLEFKHIAIALGFGAISTLVASWAGFGYMPTLEEDMTPIMILMAVIIAPFTEELAKPLGLYFMQAEEKPQLTLKEWAFLGAMAGLGFAIVENFLYASDVSGYGQDTAAMLLLLRFLLPLHMMSSAISGYGFGLWAKTKEAKYFAICLIIAMLLHAFFNIAATVVG